MAVISVIYKDGEKRCFLHRRTLARYVAYDYGKLSDVDTVLVDGCRVI